MKHPSMKRLHQQAVKLLTTFLSHKAHHIYRQSRTAS